MKQINIFKFLFNIYIFIFIFTMINREFLLFGIDLRYILIIIGLVIIFLNILKFIKNNIKKEKLHDKQFKLLFFLYIWCIISNISWLWNDLDINTGKMFNQNILLINNIISLLVFYLNKEYINYKKMRKYIIFSCLVLIISFILVGFWGLELYQISGSKGVRAITYATEIASDHKNLFGGNFRLAGYAEDANYASIFFIIGIVSICEINFRNHKFIKWILILIFLLGYAFSGSKTILLSLIIGILYLIIKNIFKNKSVFKIINISIILLLGIIISIIPNINLTSKITMTVRFMMWHLAGELFLKSPIIGNGIDSFKSLINMNYNYTWYVQCHSTYWQLLAETGIIGYSIFLIIIYNTLSKKMDKYANFMTLIYFIFAVNFETLQLQFVIYILYLIGLEKGDEINEKESIIYNKYS